MSASVQMNTIKLYELCEVQNVKVLMSTSVQKSMCLFFTLKGVRQTYVSEMFL